MTVMHSVAALMMSTIVGFIRPFRGKIMRRGGGLLFRACRA